MKNIASHILVVFSCAIFAVMSAHYEFEDNRIRTAFDNVASGIIAAYVFYLATTVLPGLSNKRRTARMLCDSTRILADAFDKFSFGRISRQERLAQKDLIKISQIPDLLDESEYCYRSYEALAKAADNYRTHFEVCTPLAISLGKEHAEQWLCIQEHLGKVRDDYHKAPDAWGACMMRIEKGMETNEQIKNNCLTFERVLKRSCQGLLKSLVDWHKLRHCKPSFFEKLTMKTEHAIETYKSLITISLEYFKSLLILNGGALVALLAYLGQAVNGEEIAESAGGVALYFISGCAFSVLSLISSYFTQLRLFQESRDNLASRHQIFLVLTLAISLVSLVLFGMGAYSCIGLIAGNAN